MIANLDMPLVWVLNSRNAFQSQTLSASGSTEDSDSFLRADCPYESGDRSEYEEYPEMVGGTTDGDGSKDT